ncbi:MAG: biotin--[acetyl-CoA-carboxylase] ligase, partial [Alphaproteobacteria bacterium]|nr:biotin--[acetyl-CoA-carboxylase] ligase [Alphaproteobacteria bacterium]
KYKIYKRAIILGYMSFISLSDAYSSMISSPEEIQSSTLGFWDIKQSTYDQLDSTQTLTYKILDDRSSGNIQTLETVFRQNDLYDNQVLVLTAREQTAGIGQGERVWASPRGNVYVTYTFPFPKTDALPYIKLASIIPLVANVSVCETVEQFGLTPEYKWINDMLLNGKKAAGMLCKNDGEIDMYSFESKARVRRYAIIVGIGINVNLSEDEAATKYAQIKDEFKQPFGSMRIASDGKIYSVQHVLDCLTANLCRNFMNIIKGRSFDWFMPQINARLAYKGEIVAYEEEIDGKKTYTNYQLVGMDARNGNAILKSAEGQERLVNCGRIRPV